jgi:short-subunit dehydrogenase
VQLNTRRILLTGASGGLGAALARQLVRHGAQVLLAGRDAKKLQALSNELGTAVSVAIADLNQPLGIAGLSAAAQNFKINVLINNAGISAFGLMQDQDWAAIEQVLTTNLIAPMRLTHAILPQLLAQPSAAVINVGSIFGGLPFAGFVAYSSAKAGLHGFSQSLRRELADSHVRVLYIAPRAISTALNSPAVNALNRALGNASDTPQAVAKRIITALSQGSNELHIGLPERLFSWLNGVAPGLIDRGLAAKLATIKQHARLPNPTRVKS